MPLITIVFWLVGIVIYYFLTPKAYEVANFLTQGDITENLNFSEPVPAPFMGTWIPDRIFLLFGAIVPLLWILNYWIRRLVKAGYRKIYPKPPYDFMK